MDKKIKKAVAGVIIKDGKIFCAQRKNYGECALKWEFPGGKLENGENDIQALTREIKEELNSDIIVDDFIDNIYYEYDSFILDMNVYYCHLIKGNLELKEHHNSCFLYPNELLSLDWAKADIKLVKKLSILK